MPSGCHCACHSRLATIFDLELDLPRRAVKVTGQQPSQENPARHKPPLQMREEVSFGALTFWKVVEDGLFEVMWLDGTGRMQSLDATRDAETGAVRTIFVRSPAR